MKSPLRPTRAPVSLALSLVAALSFSILPSCAKEKEAAPAPVAEKPGEIMPPTPGDDPAIGTPESSEEMSEFDQGPNSVAPAEN